ncbi:DUF4393 domain-containing protein [Rhodopseudomonas pseudopalustris]|uniref:Abi-alpha family protein n=1 Tax=Rhodopseudomonas pseudopalustris TaxID=1513892 RepID=UPI003F9DA16F
MSNSKDDPRPPLDSATELARDVLKAEQEQQKTYQKGMDLLAQAGAFLGGVFKPAASELGQLLGDQMRFWRFKNAVNIMIKSEELIKARGLSSEQVKALPFGEGLRLLEAASLEDDNSVQDLWARLMANSVDPDLSVTPEKMYIDVLKSFSGREACFLDLLARHEGSVRARMTTAEITEARAKLLEFAESSWRKFDKAERDASIQNLIRLRCIAPVQPRLDTHFMFQPVDDRRREFAAVDSRKLERILDQLIQQQRIASGTVDYTMKESNQFNQFPEAAFALTSLGKSLMKACSIQGD